MARHRAPGEAATTRRVASWPIAVLVSVLLVAIGWVGWAWLSSEVTKRDAAAAGNCPGGTTTIQVAADPTIANTIGVETVRYMATRPVVNSSCARIKVTSINSAAALNALLHGWDESKLGPKPQAWIPDSSVWVNQLLGGRATMAGDTTQSIASSPLVLAMPTDAARAVSSMGSVPWTQVPSLVGAPNGWSQLGQAQWGQFSLALPDVAHNAASLLALASMVDPASPQGLVPVSAALLGTTRAKQVIGTSAGAQPNPSPTDTRDALIRLGGADGVRAAPFTAVPTTEVELYERNLGLDGVSRAAAVLDEVRVAGSTAVADFPFLPLAGTWVSSDQTSVAQHFRDFLRTPAEQAQLSLAGLRAGTSGRHPNPSPGMDWGAVSVSPAPTDVASSQLLINAWTGASAAAH